METVFREHMGLCHLERLYSIRILYLSERPRDIEERQRGGQRGGQRDSGVVSVGVEVNG